MAKILFVNIPAHGHVNPTLGLVKTLVNGGHQVTYLISEGFKEKVEAAGARFRSYDPGIDYDDPDLSGLKVIRASMGMHQRARHSVLEAITDHDLIIYDSMFFWVDQLGKQLDKPMVCSITTFALNEKVNFMGSVMGHPWLRKFATKLVKKMIWNALQMKVDDLFQLMFHDDGLNIVYTSRYFQPDNECFGANFHFIGPSISDRMESIQFPLEKLQKNKNRVIYISLGTIKNNATRFYKTCIKAFADLTGTVVVMSVGKRTNITDLGNIPANFLVFNYVPQLEVLKHTDVFITHGGMNSVSEGLYFGVPLVVIPQDYDQPLVAARIAELEAGIYIKNNGVSPAVLRDTVVKVLEHETFRMNSRKVRQSLMEAGGYDEAMKAILSVLSNNPELVCSRD